MIDIKLGKSIIKDIFADLNQRGIIEYLYESGFCEAPASAHHHGNYRGGLFEHSLQVACNLKRLSANMKLKWDREESPVIVGMLHDLCKIDSYYFDEEPSGAEVIEFNKNILLKGHGEKSCIIALRYIDLTEEEIMCIRYHMGAFQKEDVESYSMAAGAYPNIIWTHTADMIASHVNGI